MRIPFGKYKGKDLRNIPHSYLDWVLTLEDISPDLRDGIRQTLGYTQVKYPSVNKVIPRVPKPPRPKKEKEGEPKTKGHAKMERELTERLMQDDLREDYELALNAPVPVMAEAAHRLWEKTKKGE